MDQIPTIKAPKVYFHHPEKNLPGRRHRSSTYEDRFTLSFAKAYHQQNRSIHHGSAKTKIALVRQVAVNGFGIADLVAISWRPSKQKDIYCNSETFIKESRPTIRAFEVKIDNWRKGMIQALRYRYYANEAILLLPFEKCFAAKSYLNTFRRIRVGLWGFNANSNRIIPYYTPRPFSGIEPKYRLRIIKKISNIVKSPLILGKH